MTTTPHCQTCSQLHEVASKSPVTISHVGGSWTVTLDRRRRKDASRWSITTVQLGDALRDAKSAVSR